MKTPITLVPVILMGAASVSLGQNFDSATFFQPVLDARHERTLGLLEVDNTRNGESNPTGNVMWDIGAGGYAGVGLSEILGVHLYAYTETTGNSLVFGRNLEILGLASALQTQLNSVVGASVLSSWDATANVSGLDIQANQLYQVTFDISTGPNIPAELLSEMEFNVAGDTVTSFGGGAGGLLNLANVIDIGDGIRNGQATLLFSSSSARTDLSFQFSADSLVNLGLLGNVEGNENVLTFSNLQVQAVPEPSALLLSALFAGGLALRRKRGK